VALLHRLAGQPVAVREIGRRPAAPIALLLPRPDPPSIRRALSLNFAERFQP